MRRTLFAAMAMLAVTAIGDATGFIVRASASGRTWQVNYAPDEPIVWVWPDKATAASLTVTSHVSRATSTSYEIAREDGAETGSWSIPAPVRTSVSGEYLYDLVLEIKAGTKVIETLTARVVILPETFDVLVADSSAWRTANDRQARPIPYDSDWTTNALPATLTFTPDGGEPVICALAGKSGFEPPEFRLRLGDYAGAFAAALVFDGTDVCTAALERRMPGVTLHFR